jgi:hypothetical protein
MDAGTHQQVIPALTVRIESRKFAAEPMRVAGDSKITRNLGRAFSQLAMDAVANARQTRWCCPTGSTRRRCWRSTN